MPHSEPIASSSKSRDASESTAVNSLADPHAASDVPGLDLHADDARSRRGGRRDVFKKRVLGATLGLALTGIVGLLFALHLVEVHWSINVAIASLTLMLALATLIYQRRQWARPVKHLREDIDAAFRGELPIDELPDRAGALSDVAVGVQELLREIRRLKRQVARMELEMSQRVRQRTSALEHTLRGLRRQASLDALTRLNNRGALDRYLPQIISRCAADKRHLCTLMIDVDDFKLLNDTLGHAAGDTLLRDIAQLIRSSLREQDYAFRYGGDEFCVVLPDTTRIQGAALAKRLGQMVDALTRTLRVLRPPRLCIGIAAIDEDREPTMQSMLSRADAELYELKRKRKHQRGAA